MAETQGSTRLQGCWANVSKCCVIPQRIVLVIMACLGVINAYIGRTCLSVAIGEIVSTPTKIYADYAPCPGEKKKASTSSKTYKWTNEQKTWGMSSFLYGYVVTHFPAGLLAERFGGKHIYGISLLVTAVSMLLTPLAIVKWEWKGLILLRVCMGLGQGLLFPAMSCLLAKWVPRNERSRLGSISFAALQFGSIIGSGVSGWLIAETKKWEDIFYVFGPVMLLWYFFWLLLCFSSPLTHPYIRDKEFNYLQENIDMAPREDLRKYPWCGLFSNYAVWSLILAEFGHDFSYFLLTTYLPIYFDEVLKVDIKSNGLYSSIPYLVRFVCAMVCGVIADYLIVKEITSITIVRKIFTGLNAAGPAVFFVLATYNNCNVMYALAMFCIGTAFMGCYYPGIRVNGIDLTPHYSGTLMGIVNGLGVIAGIISNQIGGYMTPNHTIHEWKEVFWMAFGVRLATSVPYCIWGSGEIQDFDKEDYVFPGCCKKPEK